MKSAIYKEDVTMNPRFNEKTGVLSMQKRLVKIITVMLFIAGIVVASGSYVSCASSDGAVMRPTRYHNTRVINKHLKVKGSNRSFSYNQTGEMGGSLFVPQS